MEEDDFFTSIGDSEAEFICKNFTEPKGRELPWICKYCGQEVIKSFIFQHSFMHIENFGGFEYIINADEIYYTCMTCDLCFNDVKEMKDHRTKCRNVVCNYSFDMSADLFDNDYIEMLIGGSIEVKSLKQLCMEKVESGICDLAADDCFRYNYFVSKYKNTGGDEIKHMIRERTEDIDLTEIVKAAIGLPNEIAAEGLNIVYYRLQRYTARRENLLDIDEKNIGGTIDKIYNEENIADLLFAYTKKFEKMPSNNAMAYINRYIRDHKITSIRPSSAGVEDSRLMYESSSDEE